jgi:hypothetical protein
MENIKTEIILFQACTIHATPVTACAWDSFNCVHKIYHITNYFLRAEVSIDE